MKQRLQLAVADVLLNPPFSFSTSRPRASTRSRATLSAADRPLARRHGGDFRHHPFHEEREADRCDRISLMHAGKVLAVGAPQELVKERGSHARRSRIASSKLSPRRRSIDMSKKVEEAADGCRCRRRESPGGRLAEALQIGRLGLPRGARGRVRCRDPIRLAAFALVGPIILDVRLRLRHPRSMSRPGDRTTFDQDGTPQAATCFQGFEGSRYFSVQPPNHVVAEETERAAQRSGNTQIVVEVPPVSAATFSATASWRSTQTVDGAMTFQARRRRTMSPAS